MPVQYDLVWWLFGCAVIITWVHERRGWTAPPITLIWIGLVAGLLLKSAALYLPSYRLDQLNALICTLPFSSLILQCALGWILFSGALHVNWPLFRSQLHNIIGLSSLATLISTASIGGLCYWGSTLYGYPIPLAYCFLFGALVSPTDPIAALAILKRLPLSRTIGTQLEGEALLNDAIGLLLFGAILNSSSQTISLPFLSSIIQETLLDSITALIYGLSLGALVYWMLKQISEPRTQLLLTSLIPSLGFISAQQFLSCSGALTVVSAGLLLNYLETDRQIEGFTSLKDFWATLDQAINGLIFLWIGLLVLYLPANVDSLKWLCFGILTALGGRSISVFFTLGLTRCLSSSAHTDALVLTWGGLRGGLSLAIILSLFNTADLNLVQVLQPLFYMTYGAVLFSTLVQAPTLRVCVQLTSFEQKNTA